MFTKEFVIDLYRSRNEAANADAAKEKLNRLNITSLDAQLQSFVESYEAKRQIVVDCLKVFIPEELESSIGEYDVNLRYAPEVRIKTISLYPALTIIAKDSNLAVLVYDIVSGVMYIEASYGPKEFKENLERHLPFRGGQKIKSYSFGIDPELDLNW